LEGHSDKKTYIHGVSSRGLFTSMTFSQSPEKRIGQSIFPEVGKNFTLDFESRKISFVKLDRNVCYGKIVNLRDS